MILRPWSHLLLFKIQFVDMLTIGTNQDKYILEIYQVTIFQVNVSDQNLIAIRNLPSNFHAI